MFLKKFACGSVAAALLLLPSLSGAAQQEGPQRTHALVRLEGAQAVDRSQIQLKVNGNKVEIASWQPVVDSNIPVELVIAIDEGLRTNFATNLESVKKLVLALPANVAVTVGYMRNGSVVMQQGLTTEHEVAIKSVRLPMGSGGVSGSPYFCIEDISKRWPSNRKAIRIVLMISNGIDPYNGRPTPMNQSSPYVDEAQTAAQRAGVTVYSIFWGARGMGMGFAGVSGESYMSDLSEATGGQLLSNGTMNPPDIGPFFDRFRKALSESYVASFLAPAGKNMSMVKFSTSVKKMKLYAPKLVNAGN